jgi:hypothetical protein
MAFARSSGRNENMAPIIDGDAATIGKIFLRDDAGRGMVTS